MKVEQSLPKVESNLVTVSESITGLTPDQQALLLRWLQDKSSKSDRDGDAYSPIARAPREGDIPLSFAQQRLWFLDQLTPGTATYSLGQAVRLFGPLDVHSLRRSFAQIMRRHESLRTTFAATDGRPRQIISDVMVLDLPVIDLEGLSESAREREVERFCTDGASETFDLARGPLVRVKLLRLAAQEHVLLLAMHHIISDGWSMGVLVGEMGELYEAYSAGREPALRTMPIQYADYAVWQRKWLTEEALKGQLSHWRDQLAGSPPVLELHTDYPRFPAQGYRSARETSVMGREVTEDLGRLSRGEGVTLFMTLLAGFAALLARHTGQEDVVIGTPIAGRTRVDTEGLIGVFINALALRVSLHGDPTFRELLQRVRKVTLDAYEHQALPFEKLIEELRPERDMRYTPLFQVALVVQNTPMPTPTLSSLQVSTIELDSQLTKYELSITAITEQKLTITFEYARDLFEADTMQRLLGHWRSLLEAGAAEPQLRLSELPLLTQPEQTQLLDWNATEAGYPSHLSLHQLFEQQVERTPAGVAVIWEGGRITYRELNERANQLAHYLRTLGIGPESLVAVSLPRSPELVVALLGILKAGGAYVPLDPEYPGERLAFMLADSQAAVLVQSLRSKVQSPTANARVVSLEAEREVIGAQAKENPESRVTPANLAYVIYTSGSTGTPKAVMVPHQAICNRLLWMQQEYPLTEADRVLQKTTFSFDASVWELFSPLLAGGSVVLAEVGGERDATYLAQAVAEHGVTVLQLVPSMLRVWVEEEGAGKCVSLRRVFSGGEALSRETSERFFARVEGTALVNLYGPTETSIDATFCECERGADAAVTTEGAAMMPIGRPLSNVEVYVLDKHLRQVPVGVTGELYIGGAGLARGYLGRAMLTAERFVPDPSGRRAGGRLYRTGDIGRRLRDGRLEYVGRSDEQVKLRGYRIELGEIEAVLNGHDGVAECVVAAREEAGGHKRLVAYVVPVVSEVKRVADQVQPTLEAGPDTLNGKPLTSDALRIFLEGKLPGYMVPSAFTLLEKLPLAPNGKIDRHALPAPEPGHIDSPESYQAPRSLMETLLAEIWAEALGVERIGIDDNFFALGGDSIRSLQMRALARNKGLKFSLQQLFSHQTVRELALEAAFVDAEPEAKKSLQPFELVLEVDRARLPADVEDAYPLSALQMGMIYHSEVNSSAIYQNTRSFKLRAVFDGHALETALSQIIARHMVLRTSFNLSSYSEPLQLVHRQVETPLSVHDLRHLPPSERDSAMDNLIEREKNLHFDRSRAPMVRFSVHRLDNDIFQFTMTEHHAVLDGWSVATLLTELFQLYLSLLHGDANTDAPAPAAAFRDYVMLERETLQSEDSRRYWETHLDSETVTTLPRWPQLGEPANPVPATMEIRLPLEVTAGVGQLARALSVPVKSVLLAVHLKVMSFASGNQGVATGLVINGRLEEAGGDKALGLFLNTLPFQMDLPEASWADLVRETFAEETLMMPHRRYPMAELQKRRPGQPLFETAFNFTHFHVFKGLEAFEEIQVLDLTGFGETSFTLLAGFNMDVHTQEIHLLLGYNKSDIQEAQILAIADYYKRALTLLSRDPHARHNASTLLSDEEQQQLLVEWNATEADHPHQHCLHELFEAQVARTPEQVALVCGDERLTYSALNARANRLAHLLLQSGVGPEVRVGVLMERSVDLVVALLAILKAGGAYVPLDPEYPAERLAFMLADSQAAVLVQSRESKVQSPTTTARVVSLEAEQELIAAQANANPAVLVSPANLAYVIYTSGSTGRPKGVAIEHRSAAAFVHWGRDQFGEEELSGVLASTSVCFDLSVFELFVPLSWGGKVILVQDALHLADCPAAEDVTLVNSVPSVIAEVLRAQGILASVRTVNLAGEPLPKKLVSEIYKQPSVERVVNLYGPSEDTTYSTSATMLRDMHSKILIGRPLANRQAYILDEQRGPVPVGAPGELHLSGAGLARGYLGKPGLTAEKFIPNPFSVVPGARLYNTGDIARYLPDGQIDYLGRRDNQVKLRGFRIELSEIEGALCQHAKVSAAAVVAREDLPGEKRLVAYVVDAEGAESSPAELLSHIRERLPEHMIPSAVVTLPALPLTANGKLDRRALPAPEKTDLESRQAYVAPRNSVESQLVKIWEEVIGVSPVGVLDSFFELGGHSLSAIRLMARIEKHFGRKLPLAILIHSGTVARIAEVLGNEMIVRSSPLVQIQPVGSKRAFFCIHPSGGGVMCYVDLARHIGLDRPFYGLQDPALDGGADAYDSLGQMAADYLEALRAVQPQGPYLLGGYSFGGLVAFEMAQQLLRQGQEIAALVMLDSMSPTSGKLILDLEDRLGVDDSLILFLDAKEQASQAGKEFTVSSAELHRLEPADRLLYLSEEVKRAKLMPQEFGLPEVRRYLQIHRSRRVAIRNYVTQPYPGQITLFRTSEPPRETMKELSELLDPSQLDQFHREQFRLFHRPYYGWDEVSPRPIKTYSLSGNHETMLNEPHVRQLGRQLAQYFDALETNGQGPPLHQH